MDIPGNWHKVRYVEGKRTYYYQDKDPITIDMQGNLVEDSYMPTKHIWDTFYDTANGESVDSMDKMRAREKAGQVFCSPDEASREANRNRREIESRTQQANSKEFRASMRDTLRRTGAINELRKMKRGY